MTTLLRLENVVKSYNSGENEIRALNGVSLTINQGEFVAIMGQSGSGKSTLMNIIGCLDRPTSGTYHVLDQEASQLGSDALATLRREIFGFVFQRYNLLATDSAAENVEIPAVYAGMPKPVRAARALELLKRLGLGERGDHRPWQLSGGQQQRVAIARALMNNPRIILADEPTGALDSRSGEEVMVLLKELHAERRTIILITHDEKVAAHAERVIHIRDGKIIEQSAPKIAATDITTMPPAATTAPVQREQVAEAVQMALRALRVNLFRTGLTLLGIIIGVASVVTMLAIGAGSKQKVVDQISAMGTNLLTIRPGAPGLRGASDIITLIPEDADAIMRLPNVEAAIPERSTRVTIRYGSTDYQTTAQGVGAAFPAARNWPAIRGQFFTERDMRSYAPVLTLGQTVVNNLFPEGTDPIGQYVLVKNVPFQVIGVMETKGAAAGGNDQDDAVFVPITTGLVRLFGKTYLSGITVSIHDVGQMDETQLNITELLKERHRTEDFRVRNMASVLDTATETQNTFTVLLGAVAAISLLVGGIGVMNIMLVSVTERTREIGIRMATGARTRDILLQFNIEALVVCALGGMIGVAFGFIAGLLLKLSGMEVIFTLWPPLLAFTCAFMTGLVFGYLPARKAAMLDPVVALASE